MPPPPPHALVPPVDPRVARLRRWAHQLDAAIPLPLGARVGWDAVLGLVPGFGDGAGAVLSAWVVIESARLGAPAMVLLRMVGNVGLEALVGAVPLVGDVFDAAWKANLKNVALLERHLAHPRATARSSRIVVGAVLALLVLVLAAGLALAALVVVVLVRFLFEPR